MIYSHSTRKRLFAFGGHPAPAGRALTKDLCGQYFKIKVKINMVWAKIILKLNDYIIIINVNWPISHHNKDSINDGQNANNYYIVPDYAERRLLRLFAKVSRGGRF